jgi:hypothetical protein
MGFPAGITTTIAGYCRKAARRWHAIWWQGEIKKEEKQRERSSGQEKGLDARHSADR